MSYSITELGPREAEFITTFASRNKKIFTIQDAKRFWVNSNLARKKLSHLEKKGWLARVERGKYLVIPLEAGPERFWSESPMLLATALADPVCVAYWSAVRLWNWTEQMPRIVYLQTTQRKNTPRKSIMGIKFEIVTISKEKFFGQVKQWEGETSFLITDREKTLIDCADCVGRSGGIEELSKAVKNAASEINYSRLDDYAIRNGNSAVKKRLGFLLEHLLPERPAVVQNLLVKWQNDLGKGISLLWPGGPKKGKIVTRWRLLVNVGI